MFLCYGCIHFFSLCFVCFFPNKKQNKLVFDFSIFSYTLELESCERQLNIFFEDCGCIGAMGWLRIVYVL